MVFVGWLGKVPDLTTDEGRVTKEMLTDLVPFLVKRYETEAVWMPALEALVNPLSDERVMKKLDAGLPTLVIIHDPLRNVFFMAIEYCDEHLTTVFGTEALTREDLGAILPEHKKGDVHMPSEGGWQQVRCLENEEKWWDSAHIVLADHPDENILQMLLGELLKP